MGSGGTALASWKYGSLLEEKVEMSGAKLVVATGFTTDRSCGTGTSTVNPVFARVGVGRATAGRGAYTRGASTRTGGDARGGYDGFGITGSTVTGRLKSGMTTSSILLVSTILNIGDFDSLY
jgi:hypothetical protein